VFKNRAFVALFIFFLILLIGYFGTSAVSSFTGEFYLNNPLFHVLFAFILILITVLFAFFIRNLVLFFFPHFKTNLRMKIFTAFLLLILGPALFTIFISSSVVNKGLDRLLRIQVKRIVNLSEDTTNEFQNFIADDIKRKIAQLRWKKKIYPYTLKVYGIDGFLRKKGDKIERIGDIPLKVLDLKNISHLKEFSYLDTSTGYFIVC
jgi:two-component system nitrogen regulation sensor histidine kinase NtrY